MAADMRMSHRLRGTCVARYMRMSIFDCGSQQGALRPQLEVSGWRTGCSATRRSRSSSCRGWVSNVDSYDDPTTPFAPLVARLARKTRVVVWDKRGTGLSDPVTHIPPLDERMDDLHAVLDAVDAGRPALLGISEGGQISVLFAATYPERVRSMVLYATAARDLYASRPLSLGHSSRTGSTRGWPISMSIGGRASWPRRFSGTPPTFQGCGRCSADTSVQQRARPSQECYGGR